MKQLLKTFLTITLSSTTALTLSNSVISKTNNTHGINSINENIQRYDSLSLVNPTDLANAISQTTAKINSTPDYSQTVDGVTYDYHDLLLQVLDQQSLVKESNKYDNFLAKKSNNISSIYPSNYTGVYFPWWGFGDYFYLYLSSKNVKAIDQIMKVLPETTIPAIIAVLKYFEFSASVIGLLSVILGAFPASWLAKNPASYDDGQGVYLGISILPLPVIYEVGKQSDYASTIDTFSVDYAFLAHDYITLCTDEQGINLIANYVNKNIDKDTFKAALKGMKPVDGTGWFGGILDNDYDDFIAAIDTSDPYTNKEAKKSSKIIDFSKSQTFNSINIQTRRSTATDYEYWKNS